MRWQTTLLVLHVVSFAACARDRGNPAGPTGARLDQPFTLSAGAVAVFAGENLQLGFDQVLSDSRCPRGALCIVAGDATVRVWLSKSPGVKEDRELKTPGAQEAVYGEFRIKLVALQPSPALDRTIPPSDYVATLLATRSP